MAQQNLPNQKQKKKILHSEKTIPDELVAVGQRFLKAGWLSDAADFFAKAKHTEGLESIRSQAIEEGDVFLFRKCIRALDQEAEPDHWQQLGDRALQLGKHQFAREAYRMVGNRKAMDKVDALINPPEDNEMVAAVFQDAGAESD